MKININEFFTSIQGEGLFAGQVHFFLRLSGCNIKCNYCDTDTTDFKTFTIEEIIKIINTENNKIPFRTISITGGEPLIQSLALFELLKKLNKKYKILLETNSTLTNELKQLINYTNIISMDFKLDYHLQNKHIFKEFFDISSKKTKYIKIVYNLQNINKVEKALEFLKTIVNLKTPIFLQPVTPVKKEDIKAGLNIVFKQKKMDLRLLPQIHPFINIK
ncbi:MAG: 7-carboxy-7-deazaguanine synthase QueE [Candidatus Muirbacterium halophilum]|nr:7-carboxy-7-deazaguanine synthase QueE [Candidatus Muirbacterium halophilum]MCK9474749.1 7-carboxy-7-deazaguanine synthase QueE [Candidatus Muirbacterium halophilum]